ncbi:unnamed protein product [Linum tenue]|uniref:Alpha/beta hydrolase fold-3 domain-containing protein n=1 Tax=Linum tenue TaxID=586396 RepID=A0AAV0P3S5_9ROSI|nr:unnamed protein product [Linum tenue]
MSSSSTDGRKLAKEIPGHIRIYDDGTVERLRDTDVVPPSIDAGPGGVSTKDVVYLPELNLSARLYLPQHGGNRKLPLVIYFHGGGFCVASAFCAKYHRYVYRMAAQAQAVVVSFDYRLAPEHPIPAAYEDCRKLPVVVYYHGGAFIVASPAFPMYHHCLNRLVREANVVAVSVDYRLAPENPLPAAYEDSWAPLEWLAGGKAHEPWLREYADFEKVFLADPSLFAGDSAGANIIHHLALRRRRIKLAVEIQGLVMIHPYFWGKDPIGSEKADNARKAMVDNWWTFVCPSKEGCDDPYINPFAGGAPTSVEELGCRRVVIFVAESDILCGIGKAYYRSLVKSEGHNCKSRVELRETKGEDHIFHLYDPDCEAAAELFENWAFFINRE